MSDELDPNLRALFDEAPVPVKAGTFTRNVMDELNRQARRRRLMWFGLDLAAVIILWLLSEPIQELTLTMIPWMMTSLLELGDGLWAQLLAPVNNIASILALVFLLGRSAYRRLIRH